MVQLNWYHYNNENAGQKSDCKDFLIMWGPIINRIESDSKIDHVSSHTYLIVCKSYLNDFIV